MHEDWIADGNGYSFGVRHSHLDKTGKEFFIHYCLFIKDISFFYSQNIISYHFVQHLTQNKTQKQ